MKIHSPLNSFHIIPGKRSKQIGASRRPHEPSIITFLQHNHLLTLFKTQLVFVNRFITEHSSVPERTTHAHISAVQPPVSDHPKCQDLVVAYGRWSLTRVEPEGSLPGTGLTYLLIRREFIAYISLVPIRAVLTCH